MYQSIKKNMVPRGRKGRKSFISAIGFIVLMNRVGVRRRVRRRILLMLLNSFVY
jgi:hypothetical protein